jgi:hypothetical protein
MMPFRNEIEKEIIKKVMIRDNRDDKKQLLHSHRFM